MLKFNVIYRYKLSYLLTGSILFLMVCLPVASHGEPQVQVVDLTTLASCEYLKKVEGSSGYGKKTDWKVIAQDSALKQAEKLGASHLVWEQYYPVGAFNGIAVAKIFNCNS